MGCLCVRLSIGGAIGKFIYLMEKQVLLDLPNVSCHILQNSHFVNLCTDSIFFSPTSQKLKSFSRKLSRTAYDSQYWAHCQSVFFSVPFSILGIMYNHRELDPMNKMGRKQQRCCYELKTLLSFGRYDLVRCRYKEVSSHNEKHQIVFFTHNL